MSENPGRIPYAPLIATLAMQALATMAAYSLPAAAPIVAEDLNIDRALIGPFISVVYGVGIGSAMLSPGFIHRYGAVRVGQTVLIATMVMLFTITSGSLFGIALSAVLLGFGYGATAPVSTHILVPRTPKSALNLVLSIRQIGVPLGGVLASLSVPPLALALGWQPALLLQLFPTLWLILILQWPRLNWDAERDPRRPIFQDGMLRPLRLLVENPALRNLSVTCFIYSGIQLCFVAYLTVHLNGKAGFDPVLAGQALATYQISGVVTRPIWGWLADKVWPARRILVGQGLVMASMCAFAGQFAEVWPGLLVFACVAVAGATSSGFTGIAYGEYARLGGKLRTEATALGSSIMFSGVLVFPSAFGAALALTDSYAVPYSIIAVLAVIGALLLIRKTRP